MGGSESSLKKRTTHWLHLKRKPSQNNQDKQLDLTQSIRSYLQTLTPEQLNYLSVTYNALSNERIYYTTAMRSRPSPPTIYQDFSDLLDYKYNTDVEIQLPAANFLAHKSILVIRSGYFATHLKGNTIKLSILDVLGFSEILRWIYSGDGPIDEEIGGPLAGFLHLSSSPLPISLLQLYSTRRYADCLLIWNVGTQPAHVAVLSARSPLLRGLLSKKKQLVIDSAVIPYKYSSCLLYFIYTDKLELSLISESPMMSMCGVPPPFSSTSSTSVGTGVSGVGTSSSSSSNQSDMSATSTSTIDLITNLQELYYCAQFLELESLLHSIETLLESHINATTWLRILLWSNESYGSKFIRRVCLLYAQDNWWHIIQTNEYYSLPLDCLVELISSDFTQCPESELVDSIIRWGDYNSIQLPANLLSFIRLDYITNIGLLKQITRGMNPSPSLLVQSRPRYWAPIHREIELMVNSGGGEQHFGGGGSGLDIGGGAGGIMMESIDEFQNAGGGQLLMQGQVQTLDEEGGAVGGGGDGDGGDIIIEPDIYTQLVQKYDQLRTEVTTSASDTPASENILHWLRLQALREYGLPDNYEKCLISSSSLQPLQPPDIEPTGSGSDPNEHYEQAPGSPEAPQQRHHSHSHHSHSHQRHAHRHSRHHHTSTHPRTGSTGDHSLQRRRGLAAAAVSGGPGTSSHAALLMMDPPLPDIASNLIDPIINLDLGDRFKH